MSRSGGNPMPESRTRIVAPEGSDVTVTRIDPPAAVKRIALSSKLLTTCWSRAASARIAANPWRVAAGRKRRDGFEVKGTLRRWQVRAMCLPA